MCDCSIEATYVVCSIEATCVIAVSVLHGGEGGGEGPWNGGVQRDEIGMKGHYGPVNLNTSIAQKNLSLTFLTDPV